MKVVAIIPARFESTRLQGKMLKEIAGQSILFRVYQQAIASEVFDDIIVATDHKSIFEHCTLYDMQVVMTSIHHISGTDRIAEVALGIDADIIINIQGDEPFIETSCIQSLVNLLRNGHVTIGTLCKKIEDQPSLFDYNVVKLVKDVNDKVFYFSRQAIPSHRELAYREWLAKSSYYQHMGLYGFKKETLLELVKLNPSVLELSEKLEQLRWLENGYTVHCKEVISKSFGIDTQEDLDRAIAFYK